MSRQSEARVGNAARAAQLVADAEQAALAISGAVVQGAVLVRVANAMTRIDLDRGAQIARDIPAFGSRATALCQAAQNASRIDPARAVLLLDEAERVPRALGESDLGWTLIRLSLAKAAGVIDPARAARLLDETERLAHAIAEESSRTMSLGWLAEHLANTDRVRARRLLKEAERIAHAVRGKTQRVEAFARCVSHATRVEPPLAEQMAHTLADLACALPDDPSSASAQASAADSAALADPVQAARIIEAIGDKLEGREAIGRVVEKIADTDPAHAEHLARAGPSHYRAWALAGLAKALISSNPGQAIGLLDEAVAYATYLPDRVQHDQMLADERRGRILAQVATTLADLDPAGAESLARALTDADRQFRVLLEIGKATSPDFDRAEQYARSLDDEASQALMLVDIAGAYLDSPPSPSTDTTP